MSNSRKDAEIDIAFLKKMMRNMEISAAKSSMKSEKRKAKSEGKGNQRYTLKIYPTGLGRTVYRVIEIYGKESLDNLCKAIIKSFDFTFDHLYEFCMDKSMYGGTRYSCDPWNGEPSTKTKISSLNLIEGQTFILHYDFGDDWMFTIHVQRIEFIEEYAKPKVIKQKGSVEQYPDWDEDDDEDEDEE